MKIAKFPKLSRLPTVKLNGVSQPISTEHKMVQGVNKAVFNTKNFEQASVVTLSEKKTGLSLQLQVRNKQCLQRGGRSLSSGHENRALQCQWLI